MVACPQTPLNRLLCMPGMVWPSHFECSAFATGFSAKPVCVFFWQIYKAHCRRIYELIHHVVAKLKTHSAESYSW